MKKRPSVFRGAAGAPMLVALVAVVAGCATAPPRLYPVDPVLNVNAARCPVPVRAVVRKVEDSRGLADPTVLGTQRGRELSGNFPFGDRYYLFTVVAMRPIADGVRTALEKTLAGCAPEEGPPGRKLVLDVDLASFQVDQSMRGYQVLSSASIAFSVRVFDETGERFLDSFDVKEDYKVEIQAGGNQPSMQFLVDRMLNDGAAKFVWELVPAIRRHAG